MTRMLSCASLFNRVICISNGMHMTFECQALFSFIFWIAFVYHLPIPMSRSHKPPNASKSIGQKSLRFSDVEMAAVDLIAKKYHMNLSTIVRETFVRMIRELVPTDIQLRLREDAAGRLSDGSAELLRDYHKATEKQTAKERLTANQ